MSKILILTPNPRGDLKLDREIRDLQKAIDRAIKLSQFQFEVKIALATRPEDLQELSLEHKPRIVHFCGHGAGEQGLVFVNDHAGEQIVSTAAITNLFRLSADHINCAVFNACNSYFQAEVIVEHIDYAIGMQQEILDNAAKLFAVGFYRGLSFGKSIEQSYEWACNAIEIELPNSEAYRKFERIDPIAPILPEHLKPVLRNNRPLLSVSLPPDFIEAIARV